MRQTVKLRTGRGRRSVSSLRIRVPGCRASALAATGRFSLEAIEEWLRDQMKIAA